jgi:hypothetical protein
MIYTTKTTFISAHTTELFDYPTTPLSDVLLDPCSKRWSLFFLPTLICLNVCSVVVWVPGRIYT